MENDALESIGYARTEWRFISSGLEFDRNKVQVIRNRNVYDRVVTPSKPAQGGFWGSFYTPDKEYRSDWERFVCKEMYLTQWAEKIKKPSTVFRLKPKTKVLCLNRFEDLYGSIEYEKGRAKIKNLALCTHFVKTRDQVLKDYERQPFIDFEKQKDVVDAIMVSKNFVDLVKWCLKAFEIRVNAAVASGKQLEDELIYDDQLTKYDVIFSEMFEDWHVESIFVMNPDCIDVVEILE